MKRRNRRSREALAMRPYAGTLGSLHKRLGEIRHLAAGHAADGGRTDEFFLRAHGEVSGDNGPGYEQDIRFVQLGGNVVRWDIGERGATLRLGGALSYGGSSLDMKGTSAKVDLNGPSLALSF